MRQLHTPCLVILGTLVAGCNPPASEPRKNAAATNATATNAAAPAPSAQPSPELRSIMQPEIRTIEVPEPIEPLTGTIQFGESGTDLYADARDQLDRWLADPVTESGGAIVLRGSTDSHGDDEHNVAVSRKRAQAVAAYLEAHGVAADRIEIIALGEGRPARPNVKLDGSDNPEGRKANRRVDVEITPASNASDDDSAPDETGTSPAGDPEK